MSEPQLPGHRKGARPRKSRWPLWIVAGLGLVGLVAVVVALRDWRGWITDERIAKEAEILVENHLGDLPRLVQSGKYYSAEGTPLPRPSDYWPLHAEEELARVRFVSKYGTFERMTGAGFVRPNYAWRLVDRLEMKRTIHMMKGSVTFTIYVGGTPDGIAYVQGFHGDHICVQHPDFK
jgi:hypothetical protein